MVDLFRQFRKSPQLMMKPAVHGQNIPALRVTKLSYRYAAGLALDNISFEVGVGERVAVVGPNGAGKSTLFKVISGVLKPLEGSISIYGHEPGAHTCIAYVPQRSVVDWNFPVNVADVVMMGRVREIGYLKNPKGKDWDIVHQALDVVGMESYARRQISELSGGQQQRIFIARALAQEAELMLMDEPLTALDVATMEDIFRILDELRKRKVTVMVAMHDLKLASERFDRVMLLNRRLLGLGKPESVFTPNILGEAFGDRLRLLAGDDNTWVIEDTCCEDGTHPHD